MEDYTLYYGITRALIAIKCFLSDFLSYSGYKPFCGIGTHLVPKLSIHITNLQSTTGTLSSLQNATIPTIGYNTLSFCSI